MLGRKCHFREACRGSAFRLLAIVGYGHTISDLSLIWVSFHDLGLLASDLDCGTSVRLYSSLILCDVPLEGWLFDISD